MKNKKLLFIGAGALLLLVAVILVMVFFPKYEHFLEFDFSDCNKGNSCDKLFKFNSNELEITGYNKDNYVVKINGIEKFNGAINEGKAFPKIGDKIYTLENYVLLEQTLSEYVKNLLFIPVDGNDKVISNLDDESMNLKDYEIKPLLNEKEKEIGKEFTLYGSKFIDKDTVLFGATRDTLATLTSCDVYEKYKDNTVTGVYKMTYKDGIFSDIKLVSETKLKDYKEKDYSALCNNN